MLTLIDRKQMVDPDLDHNGKRVNPTFEQIRSAYSRHLVGLDCIGMIDAALFVSLQRTHHVERLIGYHCHVLVWNIDEEKLDQRCRQIRMRIKAFVPHATSADFKRVRPTDLLQVLWYSTKTPRSQYQLHQRETRRLKQYKRGINGVNSVRLYAELGRRTLTELTLAHGQGHRVLSSTLRDARRWRLRGQPRA
ncbi:hypothetical protein [Lichenihabitans psoromatis]|uniref:hypothetical protein n=1 Tax=Lichenihabitans psoromatis TaxID=2528642 RepID=UPI0010384407|nr:hypothetical protein [Lichenihabitans psoromatis]